MRIFSLMRFLREKDHYVWTKVKILKENDKAVLVLCGINNI